MLGGLLVLCLPLGRIGRFRISGFAIGPAKMLALVLAVALATEYLAGRSRPDLAGVRAWWAELDLGARAAVAGMGCLAAGMTLRPDVAASDPMPFAQFAWTMLIVPLVALSWPRIDRRNRKVVAVALASMTLLGGLVALMNPVVFDATESTTRFAGPVGNANEWAGALLAVGAVLWSQGTDLKSRGARVAFAVLGAGVLVSLVASQSRGGLIALAVGLACYGVLAGGRRGRLVVLIVAALTLTAFFGLRAADGGPLGDSTEVQRILGLKRGADSRVVDGRPVVSRFGLLEASGSTFLEQPLIGHGTGSFKEVVDYQVKRPGGKMRTLDAHNIVSVAAVEQGILGLVGAVLLVVPGPAWTVTSRSVVARRMAAGFLAAWVMGMSIDVFDNSYFWAMLGLAWAEAVRLDAQLSSTGNAVRLPR